MGHLISCNKTTQPTRSGCPFTRCIRCVEYGGNSKDYSPLPGEETDCCSEELSDNREMVDTSLETNDHGDQGLYLSEMPLDLENLLIKKLDVRREDHLYGWEKVGTAFGIERIDLEYLVTSYKREGGSPTKDLLDMLGCQGKKISDLVNVLKSPTVNYPDIALLIQKHMKQFLNQCNSTFKK